MVVLNLESGIREIRHAELPKENICKGGFFPQIAFCYHHVITWFLYQIKDMAKYSDKFNVR